MERRQFYEYRYLESTGAIPLRSFALQLPVTPGVRRVRSLVVIARTLRSSALTERQLRFAEQSVFRRWTSVRLERSKLAERTDPIHGAVLRGSP